MKKLLPFSRRYGLLIFPLLVTGLAIDAQIFIYQRFSVLHIPESWIFHLLYLSFGPFVFFHKTERMRFRHRFDAWRRWYWLLFVGLATFYAFGLIGAALN